MTNINSQGIMGFHVSDSYDFLAKIMERIMFLRI